MAYDENQVYAKYLQKKCIKECSDCSDCNENSKCDDECSCCPPGLVAVYDDKGNHNGCLTPNDAETYHASTFTCQDGYVKLYKAGTPSEFLGCVSEDTFVELYAAVNP